MNNIHASDMLITTFLCVLLPFPPSLYATDHEGAGSTVSTGVRLIHEYTAEVPKKFSTVCDLTEHESNSLCVEMVTLSTYEDLNMTNELTGNCSDRLAIFPFDREEGHVKVTIRARRCPITDPIRLWISQGNENDNGTVFTYQQFSEQGPIHFDTCLTDFQTVNVFQKSTSR